MALETQGFQFQAPIPDLSREHPLTSLRALSFSGGGNSPLNIQPLAGWKVESAHPEKVAIGAIEGAGAIGQGITAAYMSKQAKKEAADALAKSQAREDLLLGQQYKEREKLAGISGKYALDRAELMQGIKDRVPKKFFPVSRPDATTQTQDQSTSGPFNSINLQNAFEGDGNTIPSDKEYNEMKGVGGAGQNPPEPDMSFNGNPLRNITSPVQGNQYDMLKQLQNLGPVETKYLSTDLLSGPTQTPALPVGQGVDWLRKPVSIIKGAGAMPSNYEEASKQLKSLTTPADIAAEQEKEKAVSGDTPLSAAVVTNEKPPRGRFQFEEDALDYIQQHGKNSNWFAKENPTFDSGTGTWSVKWEQKDPVKMAQNDAARQMAKDRLSRLDQAGLASEVNNFLKDPINKIMQARPMQIAEFEAAKDEAFDPNSPKSRRAVDLDAIDKFVMFARGTQPTEAQYSEIQNWTQGYLQDVKQKIEKGVEGARLSENDYETMMNLMYRAYNTTASLVNPEIQDLREIVKTKHPSLMEKELPQVHMHYEVPSYFREKLNDAQDEMRQYHALMDLAKKQNNKAQFDEADAKYKEAKNFQDKYIQDLARAKASKKPLNKKQFKRGGWKQGMFGGVSDLNAAGASQEGQ